jgi:hypothetical protein
MPSSSLSWKSKDLLKNSKQRKQKDKYLQKKYGITLAEYEQKLVEQNGCCAVCSKHKSNFKKALAVDHNHASGRIRGLLCPWCNRRRVGQLTIEWAKRVYEYLVKYDLPEKK